MGQVQGNHDMQKAFGNWSYALKHSKVMTLGLLFLGFIAAGSWYRWELSREQELNYLVSSAAGDLNSVERLRELGSRESVRRLQELAGDDSAVSTSRIHAIEYLGEQKSGESEFLASLIITSKPFVIRHAATAALLQNKCKENCLTAALFALHSILRGEPTLEMTVPVPRLGDNKMEDHSIEELKRESIEDYLSLLKSNPCLTWKLIKRDYAEDSTLITKIKGQVDSC